MSLFELRGKLSRQQSILLGIVGLILFILIWWGLAQYFSVDRPVIDDYNTHLPSTLEGDSDDSFVNRDSLLLADSLKFANATEFEKVYPLLPPPSHVVKAFQPLVVEEELTSNTLRSIWLNVQGYFWAVFISIPLGFLVGLLPAFRGLFSKQIDALRYLPLTALTGLFITWFGIEDQMKIAFLAFGILVYLLPVVVQRIDEVKDVYLKTVFTLGATDWETIRTVYVPSVLSKLIDDIRVLTAISWTYIIIAELVNRQGGVGALIYVKGRQGQIDKVFAILFVIMMVGFIQDRLFVYMDKRIFPHKFFKKNPVGLKEVEYGIFTILGILALVIFQSILFPSFTATMTTLAIIVVIASVLIILYGEFRLQRAKVD